MSLVDTPLSSSSAFLCDVLLHSAPWDLPRAADSERRKLTAVQQIIDGIFADVQQFRNLRCRQNFIVFFHGITTFLPLIIIMLFTPDQMIYDFLSPSSRVGISERISANTRTIKTIMSILCSFLIGGLHR